MGLALLISLVGSPSSGNIDSVIEKAQQDGTLNLPSSDPQPAVLDIPNQIKD